MELILVALVGFVAIALWAFVRLAQLSVTWKMIEKMEESKLDLELKALIDEWNKE